MSVHQLVTPASEGVRVTAPEAPRHLRLVGAEELAAVRRRRRMRVGGVVLAGAVIALLFAAVAMHVVLTQNQFRLTKLNSEAAVQQTRYQELQLQVDQLSSPERILEIAEGRLGMVAPATVTYLKPASVTAAPPTAPATATSYQGGPAPATASAGWSTVKPELAANS